MVDVNENLTRQVAHLSRLELSDQEVKSFTVQLSNVLKYVDQLQEVNVAGVEPLTHPVELEAPLREDANRPSINVLDSAPDVLYDGFKVPPIL